MAGFLILSIETSTGCGSVALTSGSFQNGKILAEYTHRPDVTHSRRLLGGIDHIMNISDLRWDQLDGVAVSIGPGSFTGLRIGMAAAKGIAMAANIPLIGISSLDGLAVQCIASDKQICTLLDARKKQLYAAFYKKNLVSGEIEKTSIEESILPYNLADKINEPTLLAGPGSTIYKEILSENILAEFVPDVLVQPRAVNIGFLAARQLANDEEISSPATLTPMYARASEAEINAQKKKNK
ncbi:MAG: tRNA (adenosine(37)-N6)-threonylcarbamoyltransferase complex dimerization subunit type 1 TsaB [Gammaproteobacteria bacterium]|nr:tRNA (adenosine(37)-N6)-threonylcarbamoyltransferase complex dimerization subunit type 1 TsaB [Gammaproteobacteria bacterium]